MIANKQTKKWRKFEAKLDFMIDKNLRQEIKTWTDQQMHSLAKLHDLSSFFREALDEYSAGKLEVKFYQTKERERTKILLHPQQAELIRSWPTRKRYIWINSLLKSKLEQEMAK